MKRSSHHWLSPERLIILILGGVFLLVGLLLAVIVPRMMYGRMETFSRANGRVVAMVERPGQDDDRLLYPVVEFEAPNGELYRFNSDSASSPPTYAAGDTVAVRYDPNDPNDAEIESATGAAVGILRLL
ncbi:MAG TPA: DUF3592 domain-containing protein, partial [Roseiflexaceae bacterium]|nr:DUF3592 domain-containing protein [Roseiflexaceae bacterium]